MENELTIKNLQEEIEKLKKIQELNSCQFHILFEIKIL